MLQEEFGFASVMMRDDQAIYIYLFLFLYSGGLFDTIWVLFFLASLIIPHCIYYHIIRFAYMDYTRMTSNGTGCYWIEF